MNLTKRQTEIVELLASGMTAEQAAGQLSRAIPTVRRHIQLAYQRVGARNTTHLVAISISRGFIKALCVALVITLCTGSDDGMRRSGKTRVVRRAQQVEMYA